MPAAMHLLAGNQKNLMKCLTIYVQRLNGKRSNNRGEAVLETFAQLNVVLGNVGSTATYSRNERTSIIDITFCSQSLAWHLHWRVSDTFTGSDHCVIRYGVGAQGQTSKLTLASTTDIRGWKTQSFCEDRFVEALNFGDFGDVANPSQLVSALSRACDVTMLRRKTPINTRPLEYW